jgi:hypothetical protein
MAPSFPLAHRSRSVFDSTGRRLVSLALPPRRSHTSSLCAVFDTTLRMKCPVRYPHHPAPVGETRGSLEGCVPIGGAIFLTQSRVRSITEVGRTWAGESPILTAPCFRRTLGVSRTLLTPLGKTRVARLRRPMVPGPSRVWSGLPGSDAPLTSSDSSSSSTEGVGAHAITKTPTNVAAQPYKNITICWNCAFLKSPYRIAEPMIAERVKNTN